MTRGEHSSSVASDGIGRTLSYAAYYSLAAHLPYSVGVTGGWAKRVRRAACRRLLDHLGEDANIEHGAWFGSGRGVSVGNRSGIGLDCLVLGSVVIGDDVMMGPRCVIASRNHTTDDLSLPMNRQGLGPDQPVVIEDDVWIGAAVVLLPGVRIGTGSVIAAGSIVTKDIPPFSYAAGVPCRVIRSRLGPATQSA